MTDDPHPSLDRRLREAFEPDPRAVIRIAEGALAGETRRRRPAWAAAAAAAALCLAAAIALWPSGPAPHLEPTGAVLVGSVTDGLLVVPLPDGSVAITGGEARWGRLDDGYGIVLVEGELR